MSSEQKYVQLHALSSDRIGRGFPLWLNAQRRGLLEDFLLSGIPDTKEERYRYTDISAILGRELRLTEPGSGSTTGLYREGTLVFNNGGFYGDEPLTVEDNGVVTGSLRAASVDFEELVRKYYNSVAANKSDAMAALNSAFMYDGAFVYVPAGVDAGKIAIDFWYDSYGPDELIFSRMLVVLEEGASCRVAVRYRGAGSKQNVVSHLSEVVVAGGAKLLFSEVSDFGAENTAISAGYSSVAGEGVFDRVFIGLGGEMVHTEYHCDLTGRQARSALYGLYLAGGEERMDTYTATNHLVGDCSSYQLIKGVVSGSSEGAFTGRIYVAPDADGTSAEQQSRNMTLTPTSRVVAAPQLEIYAEDVKCSHGASVGRLDEEAVYYMRQRGIDEANARRLQMSGFVNDIISRCEDDALAASVYEMASGKIENF